MHLETFIRYLRYEKRYSEHTILSYKNDIVQFTVFISQLHKELSQATSRDIRMWLVELMTDKQKETSVNRKLSSLKSYYKFIQKEGHLEINPAKSVKTLKVPTRTPEFVSEKEIFKLIESIPPPETLEEHRNLIIFELFYSTGMRRSELINLKITDIDFFEQNIKVLGKGKKERKIPLHNFLLQKIKSYIQLINDENILMKDNFLFFDKNQNQINPKSVYNIIKSYLSLCITVDKKSPHILRHTFATHLLNKGASLNSIKELLGHSSLAATQVYTHNSIDRLKEIHKQAHPKA
jgi:integrase/recombinase XerC